MTPKFIRWYQRVDHNYVWLVAGICGLSGIGWLVNTQDADQLHSQLLFFVTMATTACCISMFLLNNVRHSLFICVGVLGFFLLRYFGLRELLYPVLLLLCLFSLELSTQKR